MSLLENIVSFIGLFCKTDLFLRVPTNRRRAIFAQVSLMCTFFVVGLFYKRDLSF